MEASPPSLRVSSEAALISACAIPGTISAEKRAAGPETAKAPRKLPCGPNTGAAIAAISGSR